MSKFEHELIGRVILQFGEVEFISYRMWSALRMRSKPSDSFRNRVDRLLGRLMEIEPENLDVKLHLIEAKKLFDLRNDLAHNPLFSEKSEDGEINYVVIVEGKRKKVGMQEILDLDEKIKAILDGLWLNSHLFTGEIKYL
jgi:hypothetical protein